MCYSAESSITSYLIGAPTSLYLLFFSKNKFHRYMGLVFFVVIQMQLLEYFIWIDQECTGYNQIASTLVPVELSLQAISIIYGAYIFNTLSLSKKTLFNILIISCIVSLIYWSYNFYLRGKCTKKNINTNALNWPSYTNGKNFALDFINYRIDENIFMILYFLVFLLPSLFLKDLNVNILYSGLGFLTLALNTYLFDRGSTFSRWCYYQSIFPSILVIKDILKI